MATAVETSPLGTAVEGRLAKLRSLIRGYLLIYGAAAIVACLALCFWFSLLVDWLLEPSRNVRIGLLVLFGVAVLAAAGHWLVRRLLVPLSDRSMAMLLERKHTQLGDRLLTVVELSTHSPNAEGFDARMLENTRSEAESLIPTVMPRAVLSLVPLFRAIGIASLLAISVAAFFVLKADAAQVWWERDILLSDRRWPRATRIVVEGFPKDTQGRRVVKVARGSDLTVRAKADTHLEIPDALQVRYEAAGDVVGRPNMTQLKKAIPGRDDYQDYEYEFKNVQATIRFDVIALHGGFFGKNDRVRNLILEAVDSPDLNDILLECKFPKYLGREDEQYSVRLVRPLPEGTDVTIVASASKDLVSARVRRMLEQSDTPWVDIAVDETDPRRLHIPLGELRTDCRLAFHLHDTDGVTNQQPVRLLVRIVPDQAPEVDVQLAGVGNAVTPTADLPVRGRIVDDHGVTRTWFDYRLDTAEGTQRAFDLPLDGKLTDEVNLEFAMIDLEAQPGQKLSLAVQAADDFDLDANPRIGSGPRYELRIVTESELRSLMEARERALRRRFERAVDDTRRIRDSLSRMLDPVKKKPADDAATPKEDAEDGNVDPESRRASLRVMRTEEAIQSSDRIADDVREIAQDFDRILVEMENNNVSFIDELDRRLGEGIARPLTRIADEQFPRFGDRLKQVRDSLEDDGRFAGAVAVARREIDMILREMDRVLRNMLELQRFNELLAELRKVLDDHRRVSQLTEKERAEIQQRLKEESRKSLLD